MKQFVYGALVATAVLGAAGFAVMKEPVAGTKRNVPLKLSDLTLDRAFRYTIPIGTYNSPPTVLTAPANQGFVFTEFAPSPTQGIVGLSISINGGPIESVPCGTSYGSSGPTGGNVPAPLNPPIILRPSDTITISAPTFGSMFTVTVGGYFVYPGEV